MSTTEETPPDHPSGLHEIGTAPELARYTGRSVSTICRQAKSGRLPSIRKLDGPRGPWLFNRDAVLPKL
jgi:hypothetical protein